MNRPRRLEIPARRALLLPSFLGLLAAIGLTAVAPFPPEHRVVLIVCAACGWGFVVTEYAIPWDCLPASTYMPVPILGLLVIGAGMWASGGWESPFTGFLALPTAYAVIALGAWRALPAAIVAGLVAASPGLYTPHTSFPVAALGEVPAYGVLVAMIGIIVSHLRSSGRVAALEAQARRQSEARTQDLLTLHRVSAIVAGHLSLDAAIDAIVQELASTFGHSLISLYLREGDELLMQARIGYTSYYERIALGQGIIGMAAQDGETIFEPDVSKRPAYRAAEDGVVSEIAVPLLDNGHVAGVLNVESRARLGERDRDLMELFAAQVSVVVRNARFAGELRLKAEQDSLTGLLNHRALMDRFQHTVTSSTPCSVLLVDLNDFKWVNDTYGHAAGDLLLQHVARILRTNCREGDICGRTGGDEFVVVLPGADGPRCRQVSDRIAYAAAAYPLHTRHGTIDVSLAIGIATAPDDGCSREVLLERADRSMYEAKGGAGTW